METFVCADTHLGHKGIVTFLREDGEKERPWDNVDEMNEAIISNWNKTVGTKDKVIVLGDFVINRSILSIADRLNGVKELVMGNHDTMRASEYLVYFKEVCGVKVKDDLVMSHIPLHPSCVIPRYKGNVHGHLHSKSLNDKNYFCVSMEQIGYTPISWEHVVDYFKGE